MQRAHLVELEDLPWVPCAVRDGGTDLLDFLFARTGFYRAAAGLDYHREAVDAAKVPSSLPGLRTMFGALHHFRPEEVSALLSSLVASGAHLAFFDVGASPLVRKTPALLMPLAAIPNAVLLSILPLLMVPFVRPFRLSRLLLTYALPLVPLLFAWDGTVSALRAYAPSELLALARAVPGGDRYAWDAGTSGQAVWLTGRPA